MVPVELDAIRRTGGRDQRTDLVLPGLDSSFDKPVPTAVVPSGLLRLHVYSFLLHVEGSLVLQCDQHTLSIT